MKVFITSALPYCNFEAHGGTILTILSGDIYARFKRAAGCDVVFLCGTDEYGTATTIRAKQENLTCRELCDKYGSAQKIVYDWFNIQFDAWGQTSNPQQTKITHDIFLGLYKNGLIEEKEVTQLYCETCKIFLADKYVKGFCYDPKCVEKQIITNGDQCDYCQHLIDPTKLISPFCSICSNTPVTRTSKHLFLKLTDLTERINDYVENGIQLNPQAKSIARAWIKSGLKSRCITRDLSWGTPIPSGTDDGVDDVLDAYVDKVFYVWFDAPFGYYSILANHRDDWMEWLQSPGLEWISTMGKDNIPFHTIIFPGSILGSGNAWNQSFQHNLPLCGQGQGKSYPLISKICSTNYLLYEDQKFSKSNNIGIFGNQIMNMSAKLGINEDYWRFYLTKIRPESSDSSFRWDDFVASVNADLVNNIGNFINRCISLAGKYCNNKISLVTDLEWHNDGDDIKLDWHNDIKIFVGLMEKFKFKDAIRFCLQLSSIGNVYLQATQPWFVAKTDLSAAQKSISMATTYCWILLHLLYPFIPKTSSEILSKLKCNINSVYDLQDDQEIIIEIIDKIELPFKKLDIDEIKKLIVV